MIKRKSILILIMLLTSISYAFSAPSRKAEKVTDTETGKQYYRCTAPGTNCEVI